MWCSLRVQSSLKFFLFHVRRDVDHLIEPAAGFLSAMMRLRYPAVVDIGYAASAPMRFYSQEVEQNAYYEIITNSANRALAGCGGCSFCHMFSNSYDFRECERCSEFDMSRHCPY
jgi:hypothetical protein